MESIQNIIVGENLTSDKRLEIFGAIAGGSNSMSLENYQRSMIEEGTGIKLLKTNVRINLRTHILNNISKPNINEDGFDYSENFDGYQAFEDKSYYYNLKCVCGNGGSQTRTLREVYWFIEGQINILMKEDKVHFINILDGDVAHKHMDKFKYLLSKIDDENIKSRIYVGDLKGYLDLFV